MSNIGNSVFKEIDVASASTCDIGTPTTRKVNITGTTTITSFGTRANCEKIVRFSGILTLTHNATSLILPSGANITTGAGATCFAVSDGDGNWRVLAYQRAGGKALIGPAAADITDSTSAGRALLTAASVSAQLTALGLGDAMIFKGVIDCSGNPNYPAADRGDTYKVSVAGKIGGGSGPNVEVGDTLICAFDATASGSHGSVGANWSIIQTNIDGAVVGPASVTDDLPAIFDGTTGRLIKSKTYSAFKTLLSLAKGDVGLGNVDNTADVSKPPGIVPLGQCQLQYVDATHIKLVPSNGNWLFINGVNCAVPSGGVTLDTTGLSSGTVYRIYAYMNSGTMTLEASATAHATDSTYGHEIKSGAATRTLVGIVRTDGSTHFADTATQRFVRSYFNRRPRTGSNVFSTNRTTTSGSFVEINTEIRVEFVCFADDVVQGVLGMGSLSNTGSNYTLSYCSLDGGQTGTLGSFLGTASAYSIEAILTTTTTEDYHYLTCLGLVTGGTGTWAASGNTVLNLTIG